MADDGGQGAVPGSGEEGGAAGSVTLRAVQRSALFATKMRRLPKRETASPGVRRLPVKMGQRNEELTSLNEVYSRHIANTELACEQKLKDKDAECARWLHDRTSEVAQMKASIVIMHSLWHSKRKKLTRQLEDAAAQIQRQRSDFQSDLQALRATNKECHAHYELELSEQAKRYETQLAGNAQEIRALKERTQELEALLAKRTTETLRAQEEYQTFKRETEETQRARAAAQAEELRRRSERIEELEQQLAAVKRAMNAQAFHEAEKLRAELNEQVKLIMRIVPQYKLTLWQRENLPSELLQLGSDAGEGSLAYLGDHSQSKVSLPSLDSGIDPRHLLSTMSTTTGTTHLSGRAPLSARAEQRAQDQDPQGRRQPPSLPYIAQPLSPSARPEERPRRARLAGAAAADGATQL